MTANVPPLTEERITKPPMAFPQAWAVPCDYEHGGLTKRELIAAMAMQGFAAGTGWTPGLVVHDETLAADAVACADALLKELAK